MPERQRHAGVDGDVAETVPARQQETRLRDQVVRGGSRIFGFEKAAPQRAERKAQAEIGGRSRILGQDVRGAQPEGYGDSVGCEGEGRAIDEVRGLDLQIQRRAEGIARGGSRWT
jgi:hypothetical protein